MHESFFALEQDKRDRIINAAMLEFSAKGFKNASTNEIVKKAGISKGALFHHFSSKRDLFEFLYRYCMEYFARTIQPSMENLPGDVFERWNMFARLKIGMAVQYPTMSAFAEKVGKDDDAEVQAFLKGELELFSQGITQKLYSGIDTAKFRPDVDVPRALQVIWWVLEGFAMSKQRKTLEFSIIQNDDFMKAAMAEFEEYINILKRSFYREAYW